MLLLFLILNASVREIFSHAHDLIINVSKFQTNIYPALLGGPEIHPLPSPSPYRAHYVDGRFEWFSW